MPKRILSGVQPTGDVHLGTYLGALRNWVELQHEYESFFCVVNLHAITVKQDPEQLLRKTREVARIYLAAGIDPAISTIFVQSRVKEHAELAWILNCVTRMSELDRMTQFKEKGKKQRENTTVGLFDYPVLMASDILLYQTNLVPVGDDQKQHLELTRDIAIRFNRDFGEAFQIPEPFIPKVGARIMSLADPLKKMSKSDENPIGSIFMLDDPDVVTKKIKRAVTDSGTDLKFDDSRPAITNLLTIYELISGRTRPEIEAHFDGKGYGQFKSELAEVVVEFLTPLQARANEIADDELDNLLDRGAERAHQIADQTVKTVKERMGLESSREG
ncbi:MAG: tryptophanyl-tRNA synthetase [Blastocatellia bacterium]|jgi:tryptophanyl-tRNA synthetase|nr:tryptophanyl-tRNA synthetase [Blastocatellia bacterium]